MALRIVNLNITSKCNMKCVHCGASQNTSQDALTIEMVNKILNDMTKMGCYETVIAGGEPFQREDFMDILRMCNDNRVNTAVLTNGTLINEKIAKELGELPHLTYVRISLDYIGKGLDDFRGLQGAFDKITRNIRLLKEQKVIVGINMTLSPANINDIKDVFNYAIKEKVNFIRFAPIELLGRASHEAINEKFYAQSIDAIIRLMAENINHLELEHVTLPHSIHEYINYFLVPCAGGTISMSIDTDGETSICPLYQKKSGLNIRNMNLKDIWSELERKNNDVGILENECFECSNNGSCQGGCLAAKYARGLKDNNEQPICYKRILEEVLSKYYEDKAYRPLLSGILYRQMLFLKYGIVPCYRSFPIWMYPLKQKDEWGIL